MAVVVLVVVVVANVDADELKRGLSEDDAREGIWTKDNIHLTTSIAIEACRAVAAPVLDRP